MVEDQGQKILSKYFSIMQSKGRTLESGTIVLEDNSMYSYTIKKLKSKWKGNKL